MAQGHQSFLLKEAVPHSAERYAAVGQQRANYGQHYGSWEPSLMLIVCLLPPHLCQCTTIVYSLTQRPMLMPYGASVVSSWRGLCPLLDDAVSKSDTSHLPSTANGNTITRGRDDCKRRASGFCPVC